MTKDKTVTMSRELAERLDSPHSSVRNAALESLRRILAKPDAGITASVAAPVVKRQDKCGVQMVDCPECSHQWDHFFDCGNRTEPVSVVLPRYTCIGKGGEYERLGYAKPSGALRTIQGESGIVVYRDTETGQLYFRDPADFQQRRACLDKVKELN